MIADTSIKRPALRYYGGKWELANWIIPYFPAHDHYVEPCFGAGSVLLQKPQAKLETVNDLNGRIVNYFRVLRDRSTDLIRLIDLTPWAEDEFQISKRQSDDPLEDARRFHVMCWMSVQGGPVPTGFRTQNSLASRFATPATDLIKHDLYSIADRLRNVQILNEDALEMLARYKNSADALIYFDPPYVPETRVTRNGYMDEPELIFHAHAAELLDRLPGFVIVSGYACPLYTELYEAHGWTRVDRMSQTNSGGKRIESLWLNPRCAEAQPQKTLWEAQP